MTAIRDPRFLPNATRATLHALRGELNILAGTVGAREDTTSRRAVLRIGQLADELEWRLFVSRKSPIACTALNLERLVAEVAGEMQASGSPVALSVTGSRAKPVTVWANEWLVREILGMLLGQALNQVLSAEEGAGGLVTLAVSARSGAAHGLAVSLTWSCQLEGLLRRVPLPAFFRPVEEQPGWLRGFALGLYGADLLARRLGGRVTFERRLKQSQCRSRLILPAARTEA